MSTSSVPLSGSFKPEFSGAKTPASEPCIRVTAYLHSPSDAAYEDVVSFAEGYGLNATPMPNRSSVHIEGPSQDIQSAFGSTLHHVHHCGRLIRVRSGPLFVPAKIEPHIEAVLGLDTRPVARSRKVRPSSLAAAKPLTALQVAKAYKFPEGLTGKGGRVAILELDGGYTDSDLTQYFDGLKLPTPAITSVSVLGAANSPGQSDADDEVALDIQVAGAVAPGAEYFVYFAPNTDQGFVEAILDAVTDQHSCNVLSISWGGPEDTWTSQTLRAVNSALKQFAAKGTSFTAAGDDGAKDGEDTVTADFPATSPFTIACGGTRVEVDSHGVITSQVVWNELAKGEGAGGGGVSSTFPLPDYQKSAGVPKTTSGFAGRGVPDVAGNADPETGYPIVLAGAQAVIGGTSAVAPLYAGLAAMLIEHTGKPLGNILPTLYSAGPTAFWDVRRGANDGYSSRKGWDAASGLGSIIAKNLLPFVKP